MVRKHSNARLVLEPRTRRLPGWAAVARVAMLSSGVLLGWYETDARQGIIFAGEMDSRRE